MIFKNSLKVLLNNFNVVWKQLLYLFLVSFVIVLLTILCALPVVDMLKSAGWVAQVSELVETVYTSPKDFSTSFATLMATLLSLLKTHFAALWIYYVLIVLVVLFVPYIMIQMSVYTCSVIIETKMSSLTRVGFLTTFLSNFWKSIKFAFVKLIASLPFYALYAGLVFLYILFAKNWLSSIILFPVLAALLIFVFSLKCETLSCFVGEVIYNRKRHTWKCLFRSWKMVSHNFGVILSNCICVALLVVTVIVLVGIFTLGVGLLVAIPAGYIFVTSINLTTYFILSKKRFYVSENTIIDPV